MRTRPGWDRYFLDIAKAVSARSPDEETQVGCVIVDQRRRIISTGYNGFPPGFPDLELPATRPDKYCWMVHAEINALVTCKTDLTGSTLYCTHSPCADCVKAIVTAGVAQVVYRVKYPGHEHAAQVLKMASVSDRDYGPSCGCCQCEMCEEARWDECAVK